MQVSINKILFILFMLCGTHLMHSFPYLYVGNTGDTSVSVVDVATNEVTTTIDLVSPPTPLTPQYVSMAVTPDNKTVYVGCSVAQDGFLASINIPTNTQNLPAISMPGNTPVAIAITPNGKKAYLGCPFSGTVAILDLASQTFETPISGGGLAQPREIAITPNGLYAYVSDQGAAGVWPINLTNNSLGTLISTPSPLIPYGIAIAPNGAYAYVAAGTNVLQLNLSNPLNPTVIPLGVSGNALTDLTITADGNTLYVIDNYNATVTPVDITNPTAPVVGTALSIGIILATGPWAIVIGPDRNSAYVSNQNTSGPGNLTLLDITNRLAPTIKGQINVGDNPWSLALAIPLYPPATINGCKTRNVFMLQADYINNITWTPPSTGETPVVYNIYRDAALKELIATVPASGALQYYDHSLNPNVIYSYYITSVDVYGNESTAASVTVTKSC